MEMFDICLTFIAIEMDALNLVFWIGIIWKSLALFYSTNWYKNTYIALDRIKIIPIPICANSFNSEKCIHCRRSIATDLIFIGWWTCLTLSFIRSTNHLPLPILNLPQGIFKQDWFKNWLERKWSGAHIANSNLSRSRPDTSVARVIVSCHKFRHVHFCRRFEAEIYCGPKYGAT